MKKEKGNIIEREIQTEKNYECPNSVVLYLPSHLIKSVYLNTTSWLQEKSSKSNSPDAIAMQQVRLKKS